MIPLSWRKRLPAWKSRLYCLYPAPEPMERTRGFWLALGAVTLAVLAFSIFFIGYLSARHLTFDMNAEDFGIMDQAIWNTLHGSILHQSICNSVGDANCVSPDGFMRFAIHFEPILLPISLLYLIWSDPRMLIVVQTVVVALGAYPAFLLARLRLRSNAAGIVIAIFYLLYPAQQQATVFDFHAVTLTATFLLFLLYAMYTRQTIWTFVFAILAMACKEEIPLVVAWFGLWSIVFQRRWRSGAGLLLLGAVWFVVGVSVIMPHFSPSGRPLLLSRYAQLGGPVDFLSSMVLHPRAFLNMYIRQPARMGYLRILLAPAGGIPLPGSGMSFYFLLFVPWILVLALPSLAVNLLSSDPLMYSGLFQYNAEIVPVLVFATIEAIVVMMWVVPRVIVVVDSFIMSVMKRGEHPFSSVRSRRAVSIGVFVLLLCSILLSVVRSDYYFHGQMPFSIGFAWPHTTAHEIEAQKFIDMIPAAASVSAQTKLVPHVSQRKDIYLFPYEDNNADYIFLDVTADIYPYATSSQYISEVKRVLLNGRYGTLAANDGYLLLKYGLNPQGVPRSIVPSHEESTNVLVSANLPASFCSNIYEAVHPIGHPLDAVVFDANGTDVRLLGFDTAVAGSLSRSNGYVAIITYWQVSGPISSPFQPLFLLQGRDGKEYFGSNDVPAFFWCQSNTWRPGNVVRMISRVFSLRESKIPNGLAHMYVALLPLVQSSSTIMNVQARLPLRVQNVAGTVTRSQSTNALQLLPLTIVE